MHTRLLTRHHGSVFAVCAFIALFVLPVPVLQAQDRPPPAVVALLPDGSRLDSGGWMKADTVIMGDLQAAFPGHPRRCMSTRSSELTLRINGDAAYDDYMIEFALGLQKDNIAQSREGLADAARMQKAGSMDALDVVSVGEVTAEDVEGGHIVHYEFVENCATRSNASVARMRGFARNGTTFLEFDLTMTTGLADAKAAAAQIFERFRNLDASTL